jgi:hypothetical protein
MEDDFECRSSPLKEEICYYNGGQSIMSNMDMSEALRMLAADRGITIDAL